MEVLGRLRGRVDTGFGDVSPSWMMLRDSRSMDWDVVEENGRAGTVDSGPVGMVKGGNQGVFRREIWIK